MDKGYNKIFWGLILLSFHINLGPIQIVPGFVAWIIILQGIEILRKNFQAPAFEISERYARILFLISLFGGVVSLLGGQTLNNSIIFLYLPIIVMTLDLLFGFKILEGSIEVLRANELETKALELIYNQKTYVILYTIGTLGVAIATSFRIGGLMTIAAIFSLLIRIFLISMVNNLKKEFIPREVK